MKKYGIIVFFILLFSFFLRIYYVDGIHVMPASDMADYDNRAINLVNNHTFNTGSLHGATYRPPGYIVFLAAIYLFFGHEIRLVYLFQSVLSVLTLYGIYLIGYRLMDKNRGMLALFLSSLYIPFVAYTGILLTETLVIFLLIYGFYCFLLAVENGKNRWMMLSGVLLAFGALTRSILFPIPFLLLIWWAMENKSLLHDISFIKKSLVLFISLGIVFTPWVVRNYIEQKRFILIDTISGLNLLIGNNEYADGKYIHDIYKVNGYSRAQKEGKTDWERDEIMKSAAIDWIMHNPHSFISLSMSRLHMYLAGTEDWISKPYKWERIPLYSKKIDAYFQWSILLLGFVGGALILLKKRPALSILFIVPVYFFLVLSIFVYQIRYRLPAMPFVILLASYALYHAYELVKNKSI